MGRIKLNEVKKYGSSRTDYFHLKNDKDTAVVRFMIKNLDELEIYAVHYVKKVSDNGNKYNAKVECLAPDGIECPLCEEGNYQSVRFFIPVIHEGQVKIWERGKTFISKITSNFERYANKDKDVGLWCREFEVQRNGKKGSTDTTYELFVLDKDDEETINELKGQFEYPDISGNVIEKLSKEKMAAMIKGESTKKSKSNANISKRDNKSNHETF